MLIECLQSLLLLSTAQLAWTSSQTQLGILQTQTSSSISGGHFAVRMAERISG